MQLFNTTDDVIVQEFAGLTKIIGPGEEKQFPDDCASHLLLRKRDEGLVALNYTENEEKLYGSIKSYKAHKKIEGLKAYKAKTEQCINEEKVFRRENQQKNGGEVELSYTQLPKFEARLKQINDALKKAYQEVEELKSSKAKESEVIEEYRPAPIRRGRASKKEVIDVNAAST